MSMRQDGRSLECYVEEFYEACEQVSRDNFALNNAFHFDELLTLIMLPDVEFLLEDFIQKWAFLSVSGRWMGARGIII